MKWIFCFCSIQCSEKDNFYSIYWRMCVILYDVFSCVIVDIVVSKTIKIQYNIVKIKSMVRECVHPLLWISFNTFSIFNNTSEFRNERNHYNIFIYDTFTPHISIKICKYISIYDSMNPIGFYIVSCIPHCHFSPLQQETELSWSTNSYHFLNGPNIFWGCR